MASNNRIGIFGGAFDPIHMGHLMLAERAYEKFSLGKVLFLPTPAPYHRTDKDLQDLEHRINMVRLAIEGNDHFEFSDIELKLDPPTYTVNTLKAFKAAYPDCEPYLIVGGDTLFSIEKWYEFRQVFDMAVILSSRRKGETGGESGSLSNSSACIGAGEDDSLQDEFTERVNYLRDTYGARIYDIDMPVIDISSSEIVRRASAGMSIRYQVPEKVLDYICDNGLYLNGH